ncbi:MAG: hypothetical protein JJE04_12020 [Acidobacteriia bacterium]|nr:hypothetical protein [Terriglobia bacterium]
MKSVQGAGCALKGQETNGLRHRGAALRCARLLRTIPLVAVLAAMPALAESKQERGKKIVEAAIAALGGEKFLAMRDRVESGRVYSFYRSELRALSRATIYTRYLTRPDPPWPGGLYVRERQSFGKKNEEDYAVLFDEKSGYQVTYRGATPLAEEVLDRYRDTTRRNILYMLRQRIGEPGLVLEYRGSEILENTPVEVVDLIDGENVTVTVYFQQSTGLPLRQVFYRRDPTTKFRNEEVTIFAKYRNVGGVQWPFNVVRRRNGEKIFEIFSESVIINQDLEDQFFTLGADLKILKPAR